MRSIISIGYPKAFSTIYTLGLHPTPGNALYVSVADDKAYVADGENGLLIVDISDPENFNVTGFADTKGTVA